MMKACWLYVPCLNVSWMLFAVLLYDPTCRTSSLNVLDTTSIASVVALKTHMKTHKKTESKEVGKVKVWSERNRQFEARRTKPKFAIQRNQYRPQCRTRKRQKTASDINETARTASYPPSKWFKPNQSKHFSSLIEDQFERDQLYITGTVIIWLMRLMKYNASYQTWIF